MNKKILLIFLISIFMVSMVAPAVSAQGIVEPIYKIFSTITFDITDLTKNTEQNIFIVRLILFVALFALLFFIANTMLFKGHKNISVAIAGAISLLGTIGIPSAVLLSLLQSYILVVVVLFMAIPILGVFYARKFILEAFHDHPAAAKGLLALAFFVLATLLNSLNSALSIIVPDTAAQYLTYVTMVISFCWFFFIWYIFGMVFALIGFKGEHAGKAYEKIRGTKGEKEEKEEKAELLTTIKAEMAEMKLEIEEMDFLRKASKHLKEGRDKAAKDELQKAEILETRIEQIDEFVERLLLNVRRVSSHEAKTIETRVLAIQENIRKQTEKIKKLIEDAEKAIDGRDFSKAKSKVAQAESRSEQVINQTKALVNLTTRIAKLK